MSEFAGVDSRPGTGGEALVIGPLRRLFGVRAPGRAGVAIVVGAFLLPGLLEPYVLPGPGLPGWQSPNATAIRAGLILLWLGPLVGVAVYSHRRASWGTTTYRLDEEGVGRTCSDGTSIHIPWRDVEAVRLQEDRIYLRGPDACIAIPAKAPDADRDEILRRIEASLGADFDPSTRLPAFGPIGPFLRLVAWAILWTGLFVATVAIPILIEAFGGPRIGWLGFAVLLAWGWAAFEWANKAFREDGVIPWIHRRTPGEAGAEPGGLDPGVGLDRRSPGRSGPLVDRVGRSGFPSGEGRGRDARPHGWPCRWRLTRV